MAMRGLAMMTVAVVAIAAAGCGGGSHETKKHAEAATAGSYASLLETFATGDQLNEVSATDRFITVVHKHQAALGKTETRRELNDTAYTLEALAQSAGGILCDVCVQRLHDEADKL